MDTFDSATGIARRVRSGELDPVDVVDAYLGRIEKTGDRTNAYVTVLGDEAREAARDVRERVDDGEDLPLAGVPVAVKDLSETKEGVRNTKGLAPFADNTADETSVTVRRLEEAGAVVIGTTNTPELGHSVRTDNELQGPTATPFDLDRNAGGSSGGSAAALADGLCALATGSDVGGSLRNPASCCGVVSVKPSHGVVPRGSVTNAFRGHTPVGVLGPMARTVPDAALALDVLAGKDPTDAFSVPKTDSYADAVGDAPDVGELSIGYSTDLGIFAVAPEVREAIEETVSALEAAGADVERAGVEPPEFGGLTYSYTVAVTTFFAAAVDEIDEEHGTNLIGDHGEDLPRDLRTLVETGRTNNIGEYTRSDFVRTDLFREVEAAVSRYDALVCPTLATPPLEHDEPMPTEIDGEPTNGLPTSWMLSWLFNMTGHPVVNLPAGEADGLPVGAQFVGETYREAELLAVARAAEEVLDWGYPDEDVGD
jgi:Asp-tRNA(Asn)/Glu-tRNA(Gln) amidotransferase A subunit family amidase